MYIYFKYVRVFVQFRIGFGFSDFEVKDLFKYFKISGSDSDRFFWVGFDSLGPGKTPRPKTELHSLYRNSNELIFYGPGLYEVV